MGKKVNTGCEVPGKRPPGRPRSERARQAILSSTLEFLGHKGNSCANLTIEYVAAKAGVGKATVYRWWGTKEALIADAFASSVTQRLHFPDTGSVCEDMSQQMLQLVKILRSKHGHVISAILGNSQSDSTLISSFNERFMLPRRADAYVTLQRGIDRGELPANLDQDHVLDALYGPIYLRFLVQKDALTPSFVEQQCKLVLRGALPIVAGQVSRGVARASGK